MPISAIHRGHSRTVHAWRGSASAASFCRLKSFVEELQSKSTRGFYIMNHSVRQYRNPPSHTGLLCLEIRCFALALRWISRDQEITFDHLVEILKQGAFEEFEELKPGTKKRTMTGLKFTWDLGLV
jgi:hypothetical protein